MARRRGTAPLDGGVLDQFSNVVDGIYGAALSPNQWPAAVKQIADLHQCPKALLLTPSTSPRDGGFVFPHGLSEADLQLWAAKYVQHDPWVRAAIQKDVYYDGRVFFSEDLLPRKEFEQTIFYKEYLVSIDVRHFCTGIVFDGRTPNYVDTSCSFLRGHRTPAFTALDKKLHSLTVTHLSRALGTMFRLRDAELRLAANIAALNRISAGVLLIGERGNIVFANASALAMLKPGDGVRLRAGNPLQDGIGWITAQRPDDDAKLKQEIAQSVSMHPLQEGHFSQGILITRPSGRRPYLFQLSSLTPQNEFSHGERQAWAIAFITELDALPRLDAGLLARVFEFTPAEAALAQELLSGDALERIGERLAVSENTIKTQLQSIFAKTQTHRQAQLVKLLMGLVSTRA